MAPDKTEILHNIVREMTKEKNIEISEVIIDGGTGGADGYMGIILFFHVITKENKKIDFVWKAAKTQEKLKTLMDSDMMYERELTMYTQVIPTLKNFTKSKNSIDISEFLPKTWYGAKNSDVVNIVMENLKLQNFHIHDRVKPMDFSHMKILFDTYGKWHGVSMAFKHQQPEKMAKMVENWKDPRYKLSKSFDYAGQFKRELVIMKKMLMERGRTDLVKVYEGVEEEIEEALFRTNIDEEDLLIISHGDNWSTNYMFKYKDTNQGGTPTQVCFLDFQLARMETPAFELSSALYNMADQQTLDKFEYLLSVYHDSLSRTLKSLGSQPDELFTMSDLKKQWKKYGLGGLLMVFVYLRVALCDPAEAPDLGKMADNDEDFSGAFSFQMRRMDTFWQRALQAFVHYGEFLKECTAN